MITSLPSYRSEAKPCISGISFAVEERLSDFLPPSLCRPLQRGRLPLPPPTALAACAPAALPPAYPSRPLCVPAPLQSPPSPLDLTRPVCEFVCALRRQCPSRTRQVGCVRVPIATGVNQAAGTARAKTATARRGSAGGGAKSWATSRSAAAGLVSVPGLVCGDDEPGTPTLDRLSKLVKLKYICAHR